MLSLRIDEKERKVGDGSPSANPGKLRHTAEKGRFRTPYAKVASFRCPRTLKLSLICRMNERDGNWEERRRNKIRVSIVRCFVPLREVQGARPLGRFSLSGLVRIECGSSLAARFVVFNQKSPPS